MWLLNHMPIAMRPLEDEAEPSSARGMVIALGGCGRRWGNGGTELLEVPKRVK